MSFSLRLLVRGSCLFLPSPRGDGLYALLCPRGGGAGPRLRFNSRDLAEVTSARPLGWTAREAGSPAGFWPLAGADLAIGAPPHSAVRPCDRSGALDRDIEADLASVGLAPSCLAPRTGGVAPLAAVGLGARLRLPLGTLGAWASSGWHRLRAGWLFRGDAAGGCAFLLAEISADSLTIEDLEAERRLLLAPHARRLLELEIEPAEAVSGFAVETPELVGVG